MPALERWPAEQTLMKANDETQRMKLVCSLVIVSSHCFFFSVGSWCWDDEIASDQGITVYDAVMMQQKKKEKRYFKVKCKKLFITAGEEELRLIELADP